ncbi:MAG TPA: hypothetical protein VNV86_15800, partial [Candidatus Acidoferrum sp.]|nr:hypothetical protein [Candidatus Acidoferrum sp.]
MDDENNTPGREIISCPDPDRWLDLAAGALPRATSDRMLAHAAACNDCSLHLREAAAVFGEDTPEVMAAMHALSSSTPEWRGRTAAMLARTSRPPKTPVLRRWLSVAAAFLVVSGGALYFYWRAAQPPFGALATAYSLDRGIELRIPGASYAPMKIERGGASHRPAELLESQGAITRHLQRDPQDGRWLHARGLAEILDRRYSDAIASLRLALDLTAGGTKAAAAIYLDLATAYYGRAETERRAIDYSAALNALGQAIQINPTIEAYFNRAVINEKLHYYEPALADWKRYLELDPSSEWAKEAQERRDALVKKTGALRMDDPHRLDDLPEIQLERAMAAGLPHNADTFALAERLRQEYGDRWLSEPLQAPPAGAIAILASMVGSHASYALAQFPEEVLRLNAIDGSRLPHALQAWLEAEKLYRVSNSPNSAKCPDGADALIEKCRASGYASLLIQTMLERSTCLYTSGDVAGGADLSREALREADEHRLPIGALRAGGFLGIRLVTAGLYREVAELNRRELDVFWSRPFPPIRAQNYYHIDMVADEALGWYFAAQSAAAMSNRVSELAGMTVTQAVTNARLGLFEERTGMHAEAVR